MPSCPQIVKELPALPPYPITDNALVLQADTIELYGHAAELWIQLRAALDCIEVLEDHGVIAP